MKHDNHDVNTAMSKVTVIIMISMQQELVRPNEAGAVRPREEQSNSEADDENDSTTWGDYEPVRQVRLN